MLWVERGGTPSACFERGTWTAVRSPNMDNCNTITSNSSVEETIPSSSSVPFSVETSTPQAPASKWASSVFGTARNMTPEDGAISPPKVFFRVSREAVDTRELLEDKTPGIGDARSAKETDSRGRGGYSIV
mmetsp:Transcript_6767/g.8720  ORF Transcript_6767/g.8720 Transcript_6767/m.8720 type:complete len:131 (-) Transcript_6767:1188-1580(-)